MRKEFLGLFLLIGFFSCSPDKKVVAEVGDEEITLEMLEKELGLALYRLEREKYNLLSSKLQELVEKKLLELEAKKQGVSPETLLEEYIEAKFRSVSDQDLYRIYQANRKVFPGTFEESKETLRLLVNERIREGLRKEFIDSLRKKYKVKVYLKPPQRWGAGVEVEIEEDDPVWGDLKKAKLVVVEFSDFECPFCKRVQDTLIRLREEYKDKVAWIFRDFPLAFHRRARKAHIAANCAFKQGRFWEYQQALFRGAPQSLEERALFALAKKVGLDMEAFSMCMENPREIEKEIDKDIAYGESVGVQGTPSFFIGKEFLSGALPYEVFKEKIERALQEGS